MGALDKRVGLVTGDSKGLGAAIRLSGLPAIHSGRRRQPAVRRMAVPARAVAIVN
jgi:hypothetical protein